MRRVQTSLTENMVYRSTGSAWFSVLDIENDDPRIPQFPVAGNSTVLSCNRNAHGSQMATPNNNNNKIRTLEKLVAPHFEDLISRHKPYNLSTIKIGSAIE